MSRAKRRRNQADLLDLSVEIFDRQPLKLVTRYSMVLESPARKRQRQDGGAEGGRVCVAGLSKARECYDLAATLLEKEDAGDTEVVVEHLTQCVGHLTEEEKKEERGKQKKQHQQDDDGNDDMQPQEGEEEARALGSTACCLLAKIREQEGEEEEAMHHLDMAFRLYPQGQPADVCLTMAKLLRPRATRPEQLARVEALLRAAASAEEEEEEEEEEGEEEEDGGVGREAKEALAMLLCQEGGEGQQREADELLQSMGFRYRLGREVLAYDDTMLARGGGGGGERGEGDKQQRRDWDDKEASRYVQVVDSAVSVEEAEAMLQVFGPQAPFWADHHYHDPDTGYFSYVMPLSAAATGGGSSSHPEEVASSTMRTIIESVVRRLWELSKQCFPETAKASHAEWWAHCRRHAVGHQLHYDSEDEGRGVVRHPIASAVLFLGHEGIGGPTLVTDQRLGSDGGLASKGWLVHPRPRRMAVFDAAHLHGVVPGRGLSPTTDSRRITFMVGFWDGIKARPLPRVDGRPTANMAMPTIITAPAPAAGRRQDVVAGGDGDDHQDDGDDEDAAPGGRGEEGNGNGHEDDTPQWLLTAAKAMSSLSSSRQAVTGISSSGGGGSSSSDGWGVVRVQRPWERIMMGGEEGERGRAEKLPPYEQCFQGF